MHILTIIEVEKMEKPDPLLLPALANPALEEALYQIGLKKYNSAKKLITDMFGDDEDDGDGGIEVKPRDLVKV